MSNKGLRYDSKVVARAEALYDAEWGVREIIALLRKEFGLTPHETTVRKWVDRDYWLRRNEAHKRTELKSRSWVFRRERLRELHAAGLSWYAAAQVLKLDLGIELTAEQAVSIGDGRCSNETAARLLTGEQRCCRRRGAHLAKLSREQVIELRRLGAEGWSRNELAERFALTPSSVSRALRGESYRWVRA